MTLDDQCVAVALGGAGLAYVVTAYMVTPDVWARWRAAMTRREPTIDPPRALVEHARRTGRATALGVVVTYARGRYAVTRGPVEVAGLTEHEAIRAIRQPEAL